MSYKKIAGTAAVFIASDYASSSPVERDGMIWSAQELHLDKLSGQRQQKESMATVLALEGLEDYDQPQGGDVRRVEAMGIDFIYSAEARAWVQLPESTQ